MSKTVFALIVIFCVIVVFSAAPAAWAGTLNCTVASSCAGGTTVLRLSGSANAHAEMPGQSTPAYANNLVCCSGVTGLGTACGGANAVLTKLAKTTNAHVQENTYSDYANDACLSSSIGSVSVGYQSGNCSGYDTTVASVSGATNAHIGSAAAYDLKICASVDTGHLTVDIVDGSGNPVGGPSIALGAVSASLDCQTSTGTLGVAAQKIRVDNTTNIPAWSLTIAATGGPTALWSAGTPKYDFNDASGSPVGCADGGDTDAYAGQLTVNPSGATITAQGGCNNTGLSLGASAAFVQGTTDAVTLLGASGSAATQCYWDLANVAISQKIPAEQAVGGYSLDLTLTVTAS